MSATNWTVESSEKALDYISSEYNRLESFQEGLGERFFERLERIYERLKDKPLMFEAKTSVYRKALVNVTKRLQYAVYFRVEEPQIFVDLILPTSIDPAMHPADG